MKEIFLSIKNTDQRSLGSRSDVKQICTVHSSFQSQESTASVLELIYRDTSLEEKWTSFQSIHRRRDPAANFAIAALIECAKTGPR